MLAGGKGKRGHSPMRAVSLKVQEPDWKDSSNEGPVNLAGFFSPAEEHQRQDSQLPGRARLAAPPLRGQSTAQCRHNSEHTIWKGDSLRVKAAAVQYFCS